MTNVDSRYLDGSYEASNPGWHEDDASWKAGLVEAIASDNGVPIADVCDVGCGTGGVLREMAAAAPADATFTGFDVSPRVLEAARESSGKDFEFDVWEQRNQDRRYGLALALDVFEHVPDYIGFLKDMHGLAAHYVFHIPLDMNAQGVARMAPIMHARETVGHLHYFSKATAMATLEYAGFEIIDWRFTSSWQRLQNPSVAKKAVSKVRSYLFARWPEKVVDVLGGHSLLVLCKEVDASRVTES